MLTEPQILTEIKRVLSLESQALEQCLERLNDSKNQAQWLKSIALLQKTLNAGGKIIVTGIGKSGKIAQKIAATLSSTGSFAQYLHPTEGLHGDIGILQARDCVLALSYSGNTEELLRLLPSLQTLGVPWIAIAGNPHSKLVEKSSAFIDASITQEACPHNLAPTTSTTLALAIGDALAVTLMQIRGFDAQKFATLHPAGSIGKKLQLKVSDLMHGPEKLGLIKTTASIEQIVIALTEKNLGAVMIVDEEKLIGIITDGDLRRAFKHKEKLFSLQAKDIMTTKPLTISSEAMAWDALQLMQDRPSQIQVLPVVDANMNLKGLIRVYDITRAI